MISDDCPMILEREAGMPEHVGKVSVGFALLPLQNQAKSDTAGHPVFDDVEFVRIAVPGDRNSLFEQPATADDRRRFPQAYKYFKERNERPSEGMPIEQWPQVTRGQALTFRASHIHTVEALAEVGDSHLDTLGMDARGLREKAKAFIAQAKDTALAHKQASELQRRDETIAELMRRIDDLASKVDGEGTPEPKTRRKAA